MGESERKSHKKHAKKATKGSKKSAKKERTPRQQKRPTPPPGSEEQPATAGQEASPYPLRPTFFMALRGDWDTGGVLEFFLDGQRVGFFKLPPNPWAILASLFLAAIRSQATHWHDAFVTTKRLITLLDERKLGTVPTDQTIYRLVNTIRSALAETNVRFLTGMGDLAGKDWAELVLEHGGRQGYRIGLPPSQLFLSIGDTEYRPEPSERGKPEGRAEGNRSFKEWFNSAAGGMTLEIDDPDDKDTSDSQKE